MKLIWTAKTAPDVNNSNEKPTGSIFIDDRIYGLDLFQVAVAGDFMTPQRFSKPTMSNTLDISPVQAYNGDTITIITCSNN